MSNDQKNLLEIFEELQRIEADGPAPPPRPFPSEEPARRDEGEESVSALPGAWARRAIMAGLFLVAFGAGMLVGRELSSEVTVLAREEVQESGAVPSDGVLRNVPVPRPGPATAAAEMPLPPVAEHKPVPPIAAAESALFDPNNEFTVRAITYASTRSNEELARRTASHFRARGLPVGRPYDRGGDIFIVVGAASSVEDLRSLRDRVRGEVDPSGRPNQYRSAYITRIDNVVTGRGE
jgi:hypothetical protein